MTAELVVVSVGTDHHPFDRLVEWVDRWAGEHPDVSGLGMALITTDVAPAKRNRWIGFYVVIGTVATVLLMGVIGIIARTDWRNVFLLYLAAFPVALFMAVTYPPRDRASRPYATSLSGVRCAETTSTSCGTPKSVSTCEASLRMRQSESEPITTPTRGASEECSGRVTRQG